MRYRFVKGRKIEMCDPCIARSQMSLQLLLEQVIRFAPVLKEENGIARMFKTIAEDLLEFHFAASETDMPGYQFAKA